MPKKVRRLETNKPAISDAKIACIRATAREYVRAGGTIFLSDAPSDHGEHIGNVAELLLERDPGVAFNEELDRTDFDDPDAEARLDNAARRLVDDHLDAAFMFGAFVGLEFAGLINDVANTVVQRLQKPTKPRQRAKPFNPRAASPRRRSKAGAR